MKGSAETRAPARRRAGRGYYFRLGFRFSPELLVELLLQLHLHRVGVGASAVRGVGDGDVELHLALAVQRLLLLPLRLDLQLRLTRADRLADHCPGGRGLDALSGADEVTGELLADGDGRRALLLVAGDPVDREVAADLQSAVQDAVPVVLAAVAIPAPSISRITKVPGQV